MDVEESVDGGQVCDETQNTCENTDTNSEQDGQNNAGEYPFAPFLCAGFFVALSFGAQIIQAYLHLLGF